MNFDTEYLTRLRQRDPDTCTSFVSSLTPVLTSRLRCRMPNHDTIEDACNETFLRVFTLVDHERIRQPERFGSFVCGVCDRVAREVRRKAQSDKPLPADAIEPADPRPSADRLLAVCEINTRLRCGLARLCEADRKLLVELHLEERDRRQMARERGFSTGRLRVRLCRALKCQESPRWLCIWPGSLPFHPGTNDGNMNPGISASALDALYDTIPRWRRRNMFEHDMLSSARSVGRNFGYELSSDYESAFLSAVRKNMGDREDRDGGLRNTDRLMQAAIDLARERRQYGRLDAAIFHGTLARRGFCPLWPFC